MNDALMFDVIRSMMTTNALPSFGAANNHRPEHVTTPEPGSNGGVREADSDTSEFKALISEAMAKYGLDETTQAVHGCIGNERASMTSKARPPFSMAQSESPSDAGRKDDATKPRFSLIPRGVLRRVVSVLEFGAKRYGVDNWQHVEDGHQRYYDAAMRHLGAWFDGERVDPDSGEPHLAHAACCVLFMLWLDDNDGGGR